jgi:hypothetical protein
MEVGTYLQPFETVRVSGMIPPQPAGDLFWSEDSLVESIRDFAFPFCCNIDVSF